MVQGTGSEVGKSLLAAGLCRAFTRRGLAVRPFKPQNMSNNAAVTVDGGEIGRAQALQARACGVAPSVHMNPVLLKPQSEKGAQLVVQGTRRGDMEAREFAASKAEFLPTVLESFDRLAAEADLVVIEGAGSPAESNLRTGDIANMGFALAADSPVVLVADIERGGVIANLVGTHEVLSADDRHQIAGYVINKFRGDVSLFDDGITEITRRTGWPCFGVLPYFEDAHKLPAEDAVRLQERDRELKNGTVKIAVPVLSRIANYDDLDPLLAEPDVTVDFISAGAALPGDADLVLLPGSKSTLADLRMVRDQGWDIDIAAHLRRGGWVLGICGGYQMLGRSVADPEGVEGSPGEAEGLGLLMVETVLTERKRLAETEGVAISGGIAVSGYEMHMGRTGGADTARPMLRFDDRADGAVSADGKVMGCYLHGLFASDEFRRQFLANLGGRANEGLAYEAGVDKCLDLLAAHLEQHLDMDALWRTAESRSLESAEQNSRRTAI
ncbi:MAG TPA: cobyric acid synthase CobQ [Rhodospirillaceae bacterium]|nr:cobyric acid synthase CobQ [Rhodospirillaceae bacterium]